MVHAFAFASILCLSGVGAGAVRLDVKVILAQPSGSFVDPKLKELVQEFSSLKFSSYSLKDEATFRLDMHSTGRMQLPNGKWMNIIPKEILPDGKLRLDLAVEELKFKTQVAIAQDATLAVGGPSFEDGSLILAIRRSVAPTENP